MLFGLLLPPLPLLPLSISSLSPSVPTRLCWPSPLNNGCILQTTAAAPAAAWSGYLASACFVGALQPACRLKPGLLLRLPWCQQLSFSISFGLTLALRPVQSFSIWMDAPYPFDVTFEGRCSYTLVCRCFCVFLFIYYVQSFFLSREKTSFSLISLLRGDVAILSSADVSVYLYLFICLQTYCLIMGM